MQLDVHYSVHKSPATGLYPDSDESNPAFYSFTIIFNVKHSKDLTAKPVDVFIVCPGLTVEK
jgi:hypothetical protein